MYEKILKKLQESIYYTNGDSTVKEPLEKLAKEIEQLYKGYYPKEFVGWLCYRSQKHVDLISYWDTPNQCYEKVFCMKGSRSVIHDKITLDELYKFWQDKIKSK